MSRVSGLGDNLHPRHGQRARQELEAYLRGDRNLSGKELHSIVYRLTHGDVDRHRRALGLVSDSMCRMRWQDLLARCSCKQLADIAWMMARVDYVSKPQIEYFCIMDRFMASSETWHPKYLSRLFWSLRKVGMSNPKAMMLAYMRIKQLGFDKVPVTYQVSLMYSLTKLRFEGRTRLRAMATRLVLRLSEFDGWDLSLFAYCVFHSTLGLDLIKPIYDQAVKLLNEHQLKSQDRDSLLKSMQLFRFEHEFASLVQNKDWFSEKKV